MPYLNVQNLKVSSNNQKEQIINGVTNVMKEVPRVHFCSCAGSRSGKLGSWRMVYKNNLTRFKVGDFTGIGITI